MSWGLLNSHPPNNQTCLVVCLCCYCRYWALESEFQETVLWRHDLAPPTDHCIQQVQEWCTLARAVRSFVGE